MTLQSCGAEAQHHLTGLKSGMGGAVFRSGASVREAVSLSVSRGIHSPWLVVPFFCQQSQQIWISLPDLPYSQCLERFSKYENLPD
jgi:hypothetical protein